MRDGSGFRVSILGLEVLDSRFSVRGLRFMIWLKLCICYEGWIRIILYCVQSIEGLGFRV